VVNIATVDADTALLLLREILHGAPRLPRRELHRT
jgi:hypothetical protein